MRPVLASVASGSVTGALLTLAREASLSPLFHQLQPSVSEVCAAIPPLAENWTLDWTSFGFGLLLGVSYCSPCWTCFFSAVLPGLELFDPALSIALSVLSMAFLHEWS